MEKPTKKYPIEPVYLWDEVQRYIKDKYNRDIDETVWGWVCDTYPPTNGTTFWINWYYDKELIDDELHHDLDLLVNEGFLMRDEETLENELELQYIGEFYAEW